MLDFNALAQQCAPDVHPTTLQAVVRTESGFNPYAIGVVGGHLARQPRDRAEAVATAKALDTQGINFSMGLGQVNRKNLARYGLTYDTVFDLCANLRAGADILRSCYTRASATMGAGDQALRAAISCYYSGNFTRGFAVDFNGTSYVQRVSANAQPADTATSVVPAIPVVMDRPQSGEPVRIRAADTRRPSAARNEALPDAQSQIHPSWDAFGDTPCAGTSCK
ncbi:type IV secretion system protein VirB1 [Paraburkholderia sp. BL23I1N1]|uniref:lytic transglycosylase domain-containing protein n=1 Tax=Paraburkholderia sp. BL23I1N1 TaxID=1938802 RepID=UPI000E765204|nr:lytic transglycosylase domain-containing protein [Paraburkholderia sp. BL23I1N1]RKE23895.1 type IV secretion system protein VirB1 [Paraburkholderia sp. BL23I1N1]